MAASLELSGTILVGGDDCSCAGSGDQTVKSLGGGCPVGYSAIVTTAKPITIATPGAPGAVFVDLPLLETLTAIEFLFVRSSAEVVVRIDAAPAEVVGVGGTFPTGFSGGETLTLEIDGVAVSVAFLVGDQTAADVVARINAAAALAGLATPRARVEGGQVAIDGVLTGSDAEIEVTGGTGAATLGLAGLSGRGAGADVRVLGTLLSEFPRTAAAPARVQVSGTGTLTIVAGGRTS